MHRRKTTITASLYFVVALGGVLLGSRVIVRAQNEPDGPTGTVVQALVGNSTISAKDQERLTLVKLIISVPGTNLANGCSGSLLRNTWVITAAHCVEYQDPLRAGETLQIPDNGVAVSASWTTTQKRTSIRIITFRPYDVAIIRIDNPFVVNGSKSKFIRDIFRDNQFPWFGQLSPVPITAFGRGINQLARGSGASAMASIDDDQFRVGFFTTQRDEANGVYWYPSTAGQHIAGGDSGGPSFTAVGDSHNVLMGVHSHCKIKCLPGKICGKWPGPDKAPDNYNDWDWVADTPECADASIAPVWDDINRYLGAYVPEEEPVDDPPSLSPFAPPGPGILSSFVYGIGVRGRLEWLRHDGARTGDSFQIAGAWKGARSVGRGWGDVKWVFPGGGNVIYAVTEDGTLKWFQHKGFNTGAGLESADSWAGGNPVGRGWTGFVDVFSAGDGVIYVVQPDGTLKWYRHLAYQTGQGLETPGSWAVSRNVGRGWSNYKHVFSGGNGVIYVIANDGTLKWFRHKAYLTGEGLETAGAWEGPKTVGRGWGDVQQVFSSGNGIIYAVMPDGTLRWFKHLGYLDGRGIESQGAWEGPKDVGRGWGELSHVFALLPRTPDAVR